MTKLIKAKKLILLKLTRARNLWFATIVFFNNGFKFQDFVCNGCNNLINLSVNISNIAIITVKNVDYCCIIYNINKSEANSLLKKLCSSKPWIYTKNIVLSFGLFKAVFFYFLCLVYIKWLIVWTSIRI